VPDPTRGATEPSDLGDLPEVPGFESRPEAVFTIDVRTVLSFVGALALLFLFRETIGSVPRLLTALIVAMLFALGLDHLVMAVRRRTGWRREKAVAVILLGTLVVGALFSVLVIPQVVEQATELPRELPRTIRQLDDIPLIGGLLAENDVPNRVQQWIDDLPEQLALDSSPIESAAQTIVEGLFAGFLVLTVGVTLLLDGDRLVGGMRQLVPPDRRPFADRLGRLAYVALGRYMAGSIFVAICSGVYIFVVSELLNLPLAAVIGIWVAMTNLIPQIGGALGGFPFVALAFTQGPTKGLLALLAFLVYQQLENNVVHPIIVGKSVKLSAATTTIAALVGATAGGVVGALIAVPFLGVAKTFYMDLRYPGWGNEALAPEKSAGRIRKLIARLQGRRHPADAETAEAKDAPAPVGSSGDSSGTSETS